MRVMALFFQFFFAKYLCVGEDGPGWGHLCHTGTYLVLCYTLCQFVLVFFSPFSIVITSLGEERANLSAFHTFVRFALVWFCLFPLLGNFLLPFFLFAISITNSDLIKSS